NGAGRREDHVDVGQDFVDLAAHQLANSQRVQVVGGGQAGAGQVVEAGAGTVAAAVLTRALVVEVVLSGDNDEVGSHAVVEDVQRRARQVHDLVAQFGQRLKGGVEGAPHRWLHADVLDVAVRHRYSQPL